jgi:hypothetical protein
VKVTVVRAGGVVGLVTTTTADTASLSPADADALREHVARAGLLPSPPDVPRSEPWPDRYDQELLVEDDGRQARLRVSDREAPAEVRDLVRFVRLAPGTTQVIAPPT